MEDPYTNTQPVMASLSGLSLSFGRPFFRDRGGGNKKVFKTFQRLPEPSSGNSLLLSHVLLQCFREWPFAIFGFPYNLMVEQEQQNRAERSLGDGAPPPTSVMHTIISSTSCVQRATVALE